jgi:hypothetical protein
MTKVLEYLHSKHVGPEFKPQLHQRKKVINTCKVLLLVHSKCSYLLLLIFIFSS